MREGWVFEDQRKIKCSTERCQAWGKYSYGFGNVRKCKGCAKLLGAFVSETSEKPKP